MAEWVHNSLLIRLLQAVIAAFRRWWRQSGLRRALDWLGRVGEESLSRRLWLAWGDSADAAQKSVYHRCMGRLRRDMERLGDIFRQGLIWRGLQAAGRSYGRISARSRILSLIGRLSARQWLLLAFAWYLPIEFLIRDSLKLYALASVWEEAFMALAVVAVLWRIALRRSKALGRETVLDAWLLLFMAVGFFLRCFNQPYPQLALPGYRIVVQYMRWYFILLSLADTYILHKTRELAVMRINGFTVRECLLYAALEPAVTSLTGTAVGLWVGNLFGQYVLRIIAEPTVQYVREPYSQTFLFASAITMVLAAVLNGLALRKLKHLKLTDVNN